MIFLLKDGTYRTIKTSASDKKIRRKYRKHKNELSAVLIECFTRLHTDTFVLVKGENFDIYPKKTKIHYTAAYLGTDEPMTDENTFRRTIEINRVADQYTAASLLLQMNKQDDVNSMITGIDERTLEITDLSLEQDGVRYHWRHQTDSIEQFLRRFGILCDTDEFLDLRMSRAEMVENGFYYMQSDPDTGIQHMSYKFYDSRYLLYFQGKTWAARTTRPRDLHLVNDASRNVVVGSCISGTGLIYLANISVMEKFDAIEGVMVVVSMAPIIYTDDDEIDTKVVYDDEEVSMHSYEGYSLYDLLYIALYVPQILDLYRYLYEVDTLIISCCLTYSKGSRVFTERVNRSTDPEYGNCLDLFSRLNRTLLEPLNRSLPEENRIPPIPE